MVKKGFKAHWPVWLDRFKKQQPESPHQARYRHVALALHKLKREHHFIQVKIAGDAQIYQSMVLDVDVQQHRVVIDELVPTIPLQAIVGCRVAVMCMAQGAITRFVTTVADADDSTGMPFYCLKLPLEVTTDQRREAYRLSIQDDMPVQVALRLPDTKQVVYAKPLDLSVDGVRIALPGEHDALVSQKYPPSVLMRLGTEQDILCDLEVKNGQVLEDSDAPTTVVGGQFIDMPNPQKHTVERFIRYLQRQQRRKAMDALAS